MSIEATTILSTTRGDIVVRYHEHDATSCLSLAYGHLRDEMPPLVRLHSACLFGEAFGSLHCDCGPQLGAALQHIVDHGGGVVVYLFQEGRGVGLKDKIRAMELQRR